MMSRQRIRPPARPALRHGGVFALLATVAAVGGCRFVGVDDCSTMTLSGDQTGPEFHHAIAHLALENSTMRIGLSPTVVLLALSVALVTGIVSGFLPAWRAARMNPVDALRNE